MYKCAIVSVLAAVAVLITFAPVSDGLTCYKCSWTEPDCADDKITDATPTEECGKNPSNDTTTVAPGPDVTTVTGSLRHKRWTVAHTATNLKRAVLEDKTYFCFKVTVDKSVERGCKETDSKDDCVDKVKYPDAKGEGCTTCTTDKCNGKSGVAAVAPAAGLALMFAMTAFKTAYQL